MNLVLGNSRGGGVRGPIFLGGMRDLRPAPSPEKVFARFGCLLVSYGASTAFGCQLLHAVVAIVDGFGAAHDLHY